MLEGGWKGAGVGPDACWMGLVCSVGGFNAYGKICFFFPLALVRRPICLDAFEDFDTTN